jgi:hypothetical protein
MNGRVYDPELARFVSADPFIQYASYSQSYNRYSYVLNNPLSFTDPTGFYSINQFKKDISNAGDSINNAWDSATAYVREKVTPEVYGYAMAAIGLTMIAFGNPYGYYVFASGVASIDQGNYNFMIGSVDGESEKSDATTSNSDGSGGSGQVGVSQYDLNQINGVPEFEYEYVIMDSFSMEVGLAQYVIDESGAYVDEFLFNLPTSNSQVSLLPISERPASDYLQVAGIFENGIPAIITGAVFVARATWRASKGLFTKWRIPRSVERKVPSNWGPGLPNKKGVGTRWQDPSNPGNGVRIDKGNPKHSLPSQRVDHVVVRSNGRVIGRDGNPINDTIKNNPEQAHIPLSEYKNWSTWNKP